MRASKAFLLGTVAGVLAGWFWGRRVDDYVEEKTRGVRTKAAEGVRSIEEKTAEVFDRGGAALRRADDFLQGTKERVSETLQAAEGAIRPAPSTRAA